MDETDYSILSKLPHCGVIIAIPHYGHFAHSILGIVEKFRGHRKVCVFYESPDAHASNSVFDALGESVYGGKNPHLEILHNSRKGVLTALRSLRDGAVVVIMPDVYSMSPVPLSVPFAGSSRFAPFGTAFLCRKADSCALPAVSHPVSTTGFRTLFGRICGRCENPKSPDVIPDEIWQDYFLSREIFSQMEQLMLGNYVPWQYLHSHFSTPRKLVDLDDRNVEQVLAAFEADPRIRNHTTHVVP